MPGVSCGPRRVSHGPGLPLQGALLALLFGTVTASSRRRGSNRLGCRAAVSNDDDIARARSLVGDGDRDDWIIGPSKPPPELAQAAPGLYRALTSSTATEIALRFERNDEEANEAQKKFKRVAGRANRAVLVTACFGALLLVPAAVAGAIGAVAVKVWLIAFGVASAVSGSLGSAWLFELRQSKLLERWMQSRARAETARIEYFDCVTQPEAGAYETLLKLEYFRRYQLDVQYNYYFGRSKQHRVAAETTLRYGMLALLLATLASSLGAFLGAWHLALSALAALGVIGSALGAYARSLEAVNQDDRNAERYERTGESLSSLRGRLDDLRRAVAAGDGGLLPSFVKAVHEVLLLEHRQWLAEGERRAGVMGELEAALEKSRAAAKG